MYFKIGSIKKAVTFSVRGLDIFSYTPDWARHILIYSGLHLHRQLADIRDEKAEPSFFQHMEDGAFKFFKCTFPGFNL